MNLEELDKIFREELKDSSIAPDDNLKGLIFNDLNNAFLKTPWQKVLQIIGSKLFITTASFLLIIGSTLLFVKKNNDSNSTSTVSNNESVLAKNIKKSIDQEPIKNSLLFNKEKGITVMNKKLKGELVASTNILPTLNKTNIVLTSNDIIKTNVTHVITALPNDEIETNLITTEETNKEQSWINVINKIDEFTDYESNENGDLNNSAQLQKNDKTSLNLTENQEISFGFGNELKSQPTKKSSINTSTFESQSSVLLSDLPLLTNQKREIDTLAKNTPIDIYIPTPELQNRLSFQINPLSAFGFNGTSTTLYKGFFQENDTLPTYYGDNQFLQLNYFSLLNRTVVSKTAEQSLSLELGYDHKFRWNFFFETKLNLALSTIQIKETYQSNANIDPYYIYAPGGSEIIDTLAIVKYRDVNYDNGEAISDFRMSALGLKLGAGRSFQFNERWSLRPSVGANLRYTSFKGIKEYPTISELADKTVAISKWSVHPYLNNEINLDLGNYGFSLTANFSTNLNSSIFNIELTDSPKIKSYFGLGVFYQF